MGNRKDHIRVRKQRQSKTKSDNELAFNVKRWILLTVQTCKVDLVTEWSFKCCVLWIITAAHFFIFDWLQIIWKFIFQDRKTTLCFSRLFTRLYLFKLWIFISKRKKTSITTNIWSWYQTNNSKFTLFRIMLDSNVRPLICKHTQTRDSRAFDYIIV